MSDNVLPVFSSRSFIVSVLTSLIHFEFLFVYGVRKYSSFILLHMVDQFSQHHLLKKFSFLHCIFLSPGHTRAQMHTQAQTGGWRVRGGRARAGSLAHPPP